MPENKHCPKYTHTHTHTHTKYFKVAPDTGGSIVRDLHVSFLCPESQGLTFPLCVNIM